MRRSSRLLVLFALSAFATPGCADEEPDPVISPIALVAQRCAQVIECGCQTGTVSDVEACTNAWSSSVDATRNAAAAAGLEYDADCAARQVEWVDELGCALEADELLSSASCVLGCQLYHGYVGPGEECTIIGDRASTCAAGLECVGGVCLDICNNWRLAEGATCHNPSNPPTGSCLEGFHCDIGDTNRCVRTPSRGEPCPDNTCLAGDFCNLLAQPVAVCQAIGAVGAPCLAGAACETGLCVDNLCAPYPNFGEPCVGLCAGDLYCQSGTCTVKQGFGQSCGFDLPCASGLACDNSVCVQGRPLACFGLPF